MNIKLLRFLIVTAALLLGRTVLSAAEPDKAEAAIVAKLVKAVAQSDYQAFVSDGDAAFKQMKKEQFDAVAAQLSPKFRAEYTMSYLGDLRQKGYHVTLWKISFKNGGDDALASLSVKGGKVGGFYIH